MSKLQLRASAFMVVALVAQGCAPPEAGRDTTSGPLRVVATTGMIGDAARRLGGEHVAVTALMGPGVDPHLYKASEGDVRLLADADLILYNGLHLEGKMGDVLVKMARTRPVVAVSEDLPRDELREPPEMAGQYDPHVWFDVALWAKTLAPIERELARLAPAHAATFAANRQAYEAELAELDAWVKELIATIPVEQRVLITAHDAFGYFGRRYGIRVVGLQGISTLAEAGLKDVDRVVDEIVAKRIPAIFVESSVPRRAIEAVESAVRSRGHEVVIGGQLFSDALGAADSPAGNYPGMVRANVETIVRSLGGTL
ncbi:MAG: zinc ABC transporter substrate-binding protein [Thermoanaerobaculia bacterium]|nr:zinc ABC transporter substrate-binding protein [Thermoanaerobaculia bacterium]MBP9826246.1 zinc ABC transporter substrate-binding protein [Thermoanaerobaculia bacterium]